MRAGTAWAFAAALLAGGCSLLAQEHTGKCPKPIAYDRATLDKIQAAIEKLPPDSILHQILTDYENERDDLRFCR